MLLSHFETPNLFLIISKCDNTINFPTFSIGGFAAKAGFSTAVAKK